MAAKPDAGAMPTPALFFDTVNAFQRSAAVKAAVELDLFGAIGSDLPAAATIASRLSAPERSTRILCDYMATLGFITKEDGKYALTPSTAMFLDRRSPAYCGSAIGFLMSPMVKEAFSNLAETVRQGGTLLEGKGSVSSENPVWVDFARCMAPMMVLPSQILAGRIPLESHRKTKVLDIAAGHGMYGIAFLQRNSQAEVTALDWPAVLEVAKENARAAGVEDRYQTITGDAFESDFGSGYDLVLLTNFLHHFDPQTCEALLRKVAASLNPGGRAATIEFVVNEDRISPSTAAGFPLVMLAMTPSGDAYTFSEYERMFANAGFSRSELHDLSPAMQHLVVSHK